MSRPHVTQDEVTRVAIRLLGQGKAPSVRNIWRGLGERGSFETISKHLEAWRASLQEKTLEVLPPTLPPALLAPLEAIWTTAVQEAATQYVAEREKIELERQEQDALRRALEARSQAAEEENARLLEELAERGQALQDAHKESAELKLQLQRLERDFAKCQDALEQEREQAEQRLRVQSDDAQRQVKALEASRQDLEKRLAMEQERADAQQVHWLKLLDQARLEAQEARAAARQLDKELTQLRERLHESEHARVLADAAAKAGQEQLERFTQEYQALQKRNEQQEAAWQHQLDACWQQAGLVWRAAVTEALAIMTTPKLTQKIRLQRLEHLREHPAGIADTPSGRR